LTIGSVSSLSISRRQAAAGGSIMRTSVFKVVNKGPLVITRRPFSQLLLADNVYISIVLAIAIMDSTIKRLANIDNMPPEATTTMKRPANINTMPLEVTTTIVRELYRDTVIELDEIESLARLGQIATTGLGEVATTKKALAMLKSGIMSEDLATRLML
jgi:hypothetical protein